MDLLSGFATFFRNGGPFMFVILAIGVVALAIILERFWTIGRAGSIDSRKLLKDLEGRISQGDLVGALSLSKQVTGPVAHVASSVLSSDMRNDDRIYNAAESAATIVLPPLSRRLALLGVLANTATLLGLLGTIFGLTTAFSAVGAADPAQRSAFLAAGISQALNTTSFGLIVAIPTLLAHSFLVGKVESIVEQVEETTARITQAILRAGRHSA
ncbi:MAG: MotA/TolQ/ExbB proton channel family protein [Candidatus Eisenbacteria bacterium]|uniref:MotA/TolQ/ExbB proton channel family protein n=1 Tax=Eiseniibacteriota bacterium TaxID=2212470 RepID=A0A956NBL8_UNCEI|nr:MotA/TolQ/ExbB proton channel family protein [Candidatus Eisenbacteria bacterium]MCB9466121.1 MotA/TolQ/ExbB proton channel family protein [Candidatus Eisenbacteria bacterium]